MNFMTGTLTQEGGGSSSSKQVLLTLKFQLAKLQVRER